MKSLHFPTRHILQPRREVSACSGHESLLLHHSEAKNKEVQCNFPLQHNEEEVFWMVPEGLLHHIHGHLCWMSGDNQMQGRLWLKDNPCRPGWMPHRQSTNLAIIRLVPCGYPNRDNPLRICIPISQSCGEHVPNPPAFPVKKACYSRVYMQK